MAIKEKDLPVSGSYGPGVYVRTVSASGESQKTGYAAMREALEPPVDSALSTSSTNAVQNKVITGAVNNLKEDYTDIFKYNGINSKIVKGFYINSGNGKWVSNADYSVLIAQVQPGETVSIRAGVENTYYAFLTDNEVVFNQLADFVSGTSNVTLLAATGEISLTVPNDAVYFYITFGTSVTNRKPSILTAGDINLLDTIEHNIITIKNASINYASSIMFGNNYTYTADGVNPYRVEFQIKAGHKYQITSLGIPVNINYLESIGSTVYNLVNNVGGTNKIKTATAGHDGKIISLASGSGNVNVTIKDVTFELDMKKNIIVDQNGNGDFTTLREAIAYAILYPHTNVFVKDGVYDLLSEFATEIASSTTENYGIHLDNDVHITFSSGAKVTALYTGSDPNVEEHFQPFYVNSTNVGGFTLENLDIKASATRYCVHDEYGGADVIINNHYKNCRMEMDNTNAPLKYYPQCIGGGTGKYSYIDIEGCYFKSKRAETQDTPLVSYHNAANVANAESYINVHDCYFDDNYGTFRAVYHGITTKISKCYISGNSFGITPQVRPMSVDDTNVNFENITWNNDIRN